ncbi:hypothetical protein PHYPSEUDO_015112 [Phytophthora pseudosyringae]|uniref:Uncharacterized protein n=1 Tax=Phytophthora pseudosyringae TaxID=221518 RepID=A0A8T1VZS0_9STRA|nr:hypothetical protein PHYPSEUDO_015112 [Phytophthora pseudosyringae]
MAEPSSASEAVPVVASDVADFPGDLSASISPPGAGKRSAAEAFDGDSVEDLKDNETTLDDVLVSPLGKKSKLLDAELPDVDDNEEFPQQEDDMDADLALGLENGDKDQELDADGLDMALTNQEMENGDLNMEITQDVDELAPPEEKEDSEPPTSQNNEIDIVDVDEDEDEDEETAQYEDEEDEEEEEEDDEQETARAIARAQHQREARQLLQQLDDSARSKLCLTALEKYGEELFYGHEDARDAILVDACAQESVLSLMRDAIRVRDLYLRGSSAAAPVELDDDDDEEEEDGEIGGYEDDDEEASEEEEKPTEGSNAEIVISDEDENDEEEEADSEAPGSTTFSPGSEGQAGNASHTDGSDGNEDEEVELETEEKAQSADDAASDDGDKEESDGNEEDEETKEDDDAALGDVGAAGGSASEVPVADTAT